MFRKTSYTATSLVADLGLPGGFTFVTAPVDWNFFISLFNVILVMGALSRWRSLNKLTALL
jgi:hypothetical protein